LILSRVQISVLSVASLVALFGFAWPLAFPTFGADDAAAMGIMAIAAVSAVAIALLFALDRGFIGAKALALLGGMAALASATRIATAGVAGFELVFLFVILGGVAYGPKFGFLLGALTITLSSLFYGGFGPWTAFQLFAVGWVGLGAGLMGRLRVTGNLRIALIAGYAVISSYLFGLVMNLWFWPFAVGPNTSISFEQGAPIAQNLTSFLLYTLTTSTLTWDSVRAVALALAIVAIGKPVLAVLARAKI
jgi:hypothetical protein